MKHPHRDVGNAGQTLNNAAGFEVDRKSSGNFALKIWGRLPPNWIGSLSSGLSRNSISIVSGSAKKVNTVWQAEFEIMPTHSSAHLNKIDYLSLAQENLAAAAPVEISLNEFVLDDDLRKHDGALYLEVKASDQLGFLGALLNRLSFYTLFPDALIIETVGGQIFDRFWIKGVGGQAPSIAAIKILRQKLES